MAIYSPLRSRRLAAQKTEATQRLITFKLWDETFALPLTSVQKVTTLNRVYGDPHATGIGLTTYQGRELVVIDVGHRIFGKTPSGLAASQSHNGEPSVRRGSQPVGSRRSDEQTKYLLILQPAPDRLVGLPIDSPPSIQSIQLSAFQPLPEIYRQHSNIHCVSSLSIDLPDRPAIFLLDVDLLA
ncbi:chemotaxis protein CheW [Chamaesiphon sp.]|uniref:chemotaxis protein CheW n=1 Tax=Chamaesiphon sp. TaxID=2814140 RepID=UPI0035948569